MARILLVDDETLARSIYGDFLTGAGHDVQAVGTLEQARAALGADRFDAVVTDLILPGSGGMDVLEYVKSHHPGVEVVVITALDKVAPAVRAIKSGAAEYLIKPVAPETLAHALSRALTTRQLLRENEALREHVALQETGQRIAVTLDRDRMMSMAADAIRQACRADAVVLYARTAADKELKPRHVAGVTRDEEQLVADLKPQVDAFTSRPASRLASGAGFRLEAHADGFVTGWGVAATQGEIVLGAVVLLFKGNVPQTATAPATFLVRHFAMALGNLERFAEVEDLAYLDDLTHLFNRRYLDLVLQREVANAKDTGRSFSLLFLDLDYFKSVNDTHGHLVGSKLLVEVAKLVKACVRDNDVVCRYGGDEYVVLLRGTDSGGALKVGERIRRTVETHHFLSREGFGINITTCLGVASYPEHAAHSDELLDLADRAMYRGKKGSRNVIYIAAHGLEAPPATRHAESTS